ncbi:hypothetical protein QYE76_042238 [Lolium multiflorum]|uniref:Uncharacterized protein n=1 Tax=Lolium multiflorum TaxID=4521 RepID=A0AAD8PUZ3_LOLMU|nr:hypothetical protein QYE76_018364 [Lolium multiflorum]KAK1681390.1 hypothetical protein QYE76_042238 [Lolium multiflorum]
MAASNDDQLDGDWGKLPAELFNLIAQSLDVTVDVRLAACSKTLCRHVADNMNLHHWDGPCLLMPDSAHWHYDDSSAHHTVYHVVPLDHPRRTAILPFMDNRFWVGMNGDWIAGVDSGGNWFLANIYTHQEISLPSSETCNIFREEWIGFPDLPPERYMTYGRAMFLLKIVICEVPTKAGHYSDYKLIALFNSGLAYLANGSQEWRLFSLASWGVDYSDAIEHNGFIVAVDGWTGTTYCWDQSQADAHLAPPFVIPSPMKEPSGRWFLARSADGKRLMIIHEDRYIRSNDHLEPAEVLHHGNGLILRECPAPVIHVFEKDLSLIGPNWSRVDSLGTHSLFIGLNYPLNLKINDGNAPDGTLTPFMREFKQCLKGILPRPIKLKTSVGCAWYVHIDEYQGELVLKDGWFGFAEAHELQLDDLLVFEFLTAPSCSELQISPDPSPSISPESSLYTTGVHHRSDYAAWTPSSTDAATSHLKTPLRRRGIPDSLGPWLQWRYVSPESLALPCSNKKLKLGESLSWKETSVEPAPVCKVFGRIDEENTPDSFCKVLCTSELEVISIPSRVLPWFYGGCPESINLKMSTACTWIVDLKQQDGNVLMDEGWPEFVKAHDLKVGYLLTFKKLDTKSLQVLIFGYNCYMASSINFNQFLEKEKLKSNGSNFTDWFRHVRIFLNGGNLQYVLDAPLGDPPAETETDEVKNVYMTRKTRYSQVQCAILCSLESDLQKRFEHHDPHELIKELKTIFETHAAVECYEASKHFFSCMMEEGSSISEHMLVMTGHAKKLSDLGIVIPNRLGINRVLQSLPPSYKNFVMNYNMQNMNKEFPELFGMLKAAEIEIKKEHQVLMVNKTTSFKKQGKSKGKNKKSGKKAATPPVKPKSGPKPDAECYYCKEKGHWKRNCSKYLADLKSGLIKKKKEEFLTKEVTGRKVELDEIEESLLVDQSSAVPENVPVPPTPATEEANDNDHETSNETATEPRRSTRDRATPDWYDPCLNVMIVDNNDEDPATYEEAMMSPDSNKWQEAMKSEMGSMYDNKVWTLVDLPDSRKAVENKWIFKRKTDADGNITVYKARLVAKGFRQIQGVDYDETFSPVAKLKSVRILLAIAAFFDYEIWQMDVKTAFLNGDIEEELYMVQPKGFVDPKNADKVCKLQRSIYGLKQASRSWNRRFDKVIKDFGFIQCHGEACIYKKVSGSSVAFLILYVDDILLIGNDIELLSSVKGYLNNSFSMKDLGEASYILGIKIYRDRSRRLIGLSQSTYLDKILKKFRMDESKKGFLPMLPGKVLSKTQGPATAEERERMSQIPYASAVGSIMYAMLCTRPDIAHAVSLTSRYQSDPGMEHWTAVKNILKYLKRTKDMFLCYGGDQELVVTSYTDASWNTDPDDSKSQSGYVFILNGAAVSWASSKQCTVAKSSTESEYIAASEASSEAVWMKRFIVELGVVPSALDPFVIYCDNMGAIANAQEPRSHKRLKHIKLRYHSIREYIEDGEVKICKVHTDLNVADPLTKALPRAKHDQHQNAMGVRYITM